MCLNHNNCFIITLTGPSMSGKSYVMDKIEQEQDRLKNDGIIFEPVRVAKYTTRAYRLEELRQIKDGIHVDVKSVAKIPDDCNLVYKTYGKKYGLSFRELEYLLKKGKSPVIVINDVRVVEEIKACFPGKVLSLFLFRKIPELKDFRNTSASRGNVSINEAKERYNKAIAIYRTYIENITLFDRVILNVKNFSGKKGEIDYTGLQIHNLLHAIIIGNVKLETHEKKPSKKMFIVSGSAASGKDEIIRSVELMGKMQAFILPKYTTRAQEPDDGSEMICRLIPKASIIDKLEKDYFADCHEIEIRQEPPKEFVDITKKSYDSNSFIKEDFREYLSVRWEAKRLAMLKEIPTPNQRFWQLVELNRRKLQRKKLDLDYIATEIQKEFFEINSEYVSIEDIYEKNKDYFYECTLNQEIGVSGPACCLNDNGTKYIVYKNNKNILYGFKLTSYDGHLLTEKMSTENKHCIIAASLTEIFRLCKEQLNDDVVTIFAYSQISAENYKKRTKEGTANAKAAAVEKDIERYSKYIEYFDHVSIYAESVYGNTHGSADEELVDQIFRLFRSYN